MDMRFSISRLKTYTHCQRGFYLQYIKKAPSKQNIYAHIGGCVHEILEDLQGSKITKEQALEKYDDVLIECEFLGYKFPSDKVKLNYEESVRHYLEHYKPFDGKVEMEKEIHGTVEGIEFIGFVDLIRYNDDGTITIFDYKTSSKYSDKEMMDYAMQLILYGVILEEFYDLKVRDVGFVFLKYANVPVISRGKEKIKAVLRSEFPSGVEGEQCIVTVPYIDEAKNKLRKFVSDTVKRIKIRDFENINEWQPVYFSKQTTFFCNTLCGVKESCEPYQRWLFLNGEQTKKKSTDEDLF